MSEMVERVARGLAAHSWELIGNDHAKEPFIDRRWPHYVGQARAAIEAMREPQMDMVAAFWRQKNTGTQEVGERSDATSDYDAYRAMIDAALKP